MREHSGFRSWALLAAVCAPLTVAEGAVLSYAEPQTGRKVHEYRISLPVRRTERQEFHIPDDCPKVAAAVSGGAGRWGSRVDRTLWSKVTSDCQFHDLVQNARQDPEHDFVSNYDFKNAAISDLPFGQRCTGPLPGPDCPPEPPGFAHFMSFMDAGPGEFDGARPCEIVDGMFRGRLIRTPTGLRCLPGPHHHTPGFRLISVAFADVNHDGYQDAVLRLVPLGPGVSHIPVLLPVTRFSEDGPFVVPQGVALS